MKLETRLVNIADQNLAALEIHAHERLTFDIATQAWRGKLSWVLVVLLSRRFREVNSRWWFSDEPRRKLFRDAKNLAVPFQ